LIERASLQLCSALERTYTVFEKKRPQIPRLCFVGTFAQAAVASIDAVNLNGIVYARSAAAAADSDR